MGMLNPVPSKWNQWLGWTTSPDKGWCMYTGHANRVGYLNAVLNLAGQGTQPGNKYYGVATRNGVVAFKTFCNIGGNPEVCDSATWATIDWFAAANQAQF